MVFCALPRTSGLGGRQWWGRMPSEAPTGWGCRQARKIPAAGPTSPVSDRYCCCVQTAAESGPIRYRSPTDPLPLEL